MFPVCRSCGSGAVQEVGPLPHCDTFAGINRIGLFPPASLQRCASCGSKQRSHALAEDEYRTLYAAKGAKILGEHLKPDHRIARNFICSIPLSSVLDVGAGGGAFLKSFSGDTRRAAMDYSPAVAATLAKTGIEVDSSPAGPFDLVTAFNVIEHTPDPATFISSLAKLSRDLIILSTGDPDAPAWNRHGSGFWYCSFPEHVTFPSEAAISAALSRNGFALLRSVPYRYSRNPAKAAAARLLQGTHTYVPWAHRILSSLLFGSDHRLSASAGYLDQRLYFARRVSTHPRTMVHQTRTVAPVPGAASSARVNPLVLGLPLSLTK